MSFKVKELLKNKRVILASASPRRKELLRLLVDDFEIVPSNADESDPETDDVFTIPEILAERKCREVAQRCKDDDNTIVIGCDTLVIDPDCTPMGKPKDEADALDMLLRLQGTKHWVVSGVCVYYRGRYSRFSEETEVIFISADESELKAYIASGEPFDKAGAYAIQGLGGLFAEAILGDYNNVVGLPVTHLSEFLNGMLGDTDETER